MSRTSVGQIVQTRDWQPRRDAQTAAETKTLEGRSAVEVRFSPDVVSLYETPVQLTLPVSLSMVLKQTTVLLTEFCLCLKVLPH